MVVNLKRGEGRPIRTRTTDILVTRYAEHAAPQADLPSTSPTCVDRSCSSLFETEVTRARVEIHFHVKKKKKAVDSLRDGSDRNGTRIKKASMETQREWCAQTSFSGLQKW